MLSIFESIFDNSRMPLREMDKKMNSYLYTPKNHFAKKEYTISSRSEDSSTVTVKSPFLGQWTFDIKIPINKLKTSLETYCEGTQTIQNIFPNLTPEIRDQFLTDPSLYENTIDH